MSVFLFKMRHRGQPWWGDIHTLPATRDHWYHFRKYARLHKGQFHYLVRSPSGDWQEVL